MSKKILVCDDDEGILNMIGLLLKTKGFTVIKQLHSIHVLHDARIHKPDLIVLDLWMPVMNGEEVVKELKNDCDGKNIPILIVSASKDGQAIAEKIGANGFVAKPFDIRDFISKVNQYTDT